MKNNEEFRASVFEKAATYEANRKKKRKERTRRVLALAVCALIAVPAIWIPVSLTVGNLSTAGSTMPALSTGVGTMGTLPHTTIVCNTTEAHTTTIAGTSETTGALQTTVHGTTSAGSTMPALGTSVGTMGTLPHTTIVCTTTGAHTTTIVETSETTGVLQTTVHSTTSATAGPDVGLDFINIVSDVFLGEAQNIATHEVILKSREEALQYNSGEGMVNFLDEYLGKNFFENFAVVGYYLEIPAEKEIYIKVELDGNGNIVCTISCEAGEYGEHGGNKKAVLANIGISKKWLAEGHDVIFIVAED